MTAETITALVELALMVCVAGMALSALSIIGALSDVFAAKRRRRKGK